MPPTLGSCRVGRRHFGRAGAARRLVPRVGQPSGIPATPARPPAPPPAMRMSPPLLGRGLLPSPPSTAPAARCPRLPRLRRARAVTCATLSQVGMEGLGVVWGYPVPLLPVQGSADPPESPTPWLRFPPRSPSSALHLLLWLCPISPAPPWSLHPCVCLGSGPWACSPLCTPAMCLLGIVPKDIDIPPHLPFQEPSRGSPTSSASGGRAGAGSTRSCHAAPSRLMPPSASRCHP